MINLILRDNKIEISFKGNRFDFILSFMKEFKFKYIPENKTWTASTLMIKETLDKLEMIDDLYMSNDVRDFILNYKVEPETEFKRRLFKKELMKLPPVVGIPPNEDYQLIDAMKGICQNRLYLQHEQGSGKTKILMDIVNHLWYYKEIDKILILAPSHALCNWRRSIIKFSNFFTEDDIIIADVRENRKPFVEPYKICISSYNTFRLISNYYYVDNGGKKGVKKYRSPTIPFENWGNNRCLISDESNALKNSSLQFHVVNLHKKFFHFRYFASGTPFPNGIHEAYNQFKILDEGIIPYDYYTWLNKIANIGNKFSEYAINYFYEDKVEEFYNQISSYCIRRLTKECLELPDLLINKIYVEMSPLHKNIYIGLIQSIFFVLKEEGQFVSPNQVIQKFPYILQAIHNPCLLSGKLDIDINRNLCSMIDKWDFEENNKIDILTSLLEKYIKDEKNKVVVWSTHPLTLNQLAEKFKKYKPLIIHGQVKTNDKREYIDTTLDSFRKGKEYNLLLANPKVLSTAIDLIESTRFIYFDRSYDLTEWLQSIKRSHRIGQTKKVIINPLIFEKSLELNIDECLTKKEDINKSLLRREFIDKNEWIKIFRGEVLF